jgi:proteasome lid subunit RPN8/RPN11
MIEKPKVVIDNEVYRKIMYWVNKSQYEVSGLGTLVLEAKNTFRVKSAMLLPQKNTKTHTDIESEDVGKLMYALREAPGELRFWWHSHVEMPVFWSGTDRDTIQKLGQGGWFLSSVFNKKKEIRSAYYAIAGTTTPFGSQPLFLDELETKVEKFPDPLEAAWDEEYTKNVTNVTYMDSPYSSGVLAYQGGEWVNRSYQNHHPAAVSTTPGTSSGQPGRKRPEGMSKREWKRLKRSMGNTALPSPTPISGLRQIYDEYGLTQAERSILAREGWDEMDLDDAQRSGMEAADIMLLASKGMNMEDLRGLLEEGWTINDALAFQANDPSAPSEDEVDDDVPVMDRGRAGVYDGVQ